MLFALALAVTVLASPLPGVSVSPPPKGAVFLVIDSSEGPATAVRRSTSVAVESTAGAFLGGFLAQFAVVKPHRSSPDAVPTLQMFVLIAPMKGQVGLHAVGSF
jgi:hypothetical protein